MYDRENPMRKLWAVVSNSGLILAHHLELAFYTKARHQQQELGEEDRYARAKFLNFLCKPENGFRKSIGFGKERGRGLFIFS